MRRKFPSDADAKHTTGSGRGRQPDKHGWLYLAAVLDLYSRKIVGWAMAPGMPAELVCAALQMAIAQRQPSAGLIVHSDRGSQYASEMYQLLLAKHGLFCSMSRKGNCWDTQSILVENACQI